MQKMTPDFNREFLSSIDFIADNGATQKRTMKSDLVRAAGQRVKFQQGVIPKTLNRLVFRDRFSPPALGDDRHPFAMTRVAPDVRFDPTGGRGRLSIDQRQIGFLDLPESELILQPAMSSLVLRKQDQSGRFLVEAMNHTGTLLAANAFNVWFISQYGIHQRP